MGSGVDPVELGAGVAGIGLLAGRGVRVAR
jgi:hypothetical protein